MKFSLSAQIAEIMRELKMREEVYGRRVSTCRMRQSEAEYYMGCMRATLATLEWLKANEATIKQAVNHQ